MFAKVFAQIFDSSIADNHKHRHIFMDLLVLAKSDGSVDMTMEAIARRTNVPLDEVREAIAFLSAPDDRSNSPNEEGRRLLPVNPQKPWGWRIVNYQRYREIRDDAARREYMREYRRTERAEKKANTKPAKKKNGVKLARRGEYSHDMRYPSEPIEHKPDCPCVECKALHPQEEEAF